jgi:phosphohistidine phosphatase
MRTLTLMRHGEASQKAPGGSDHDRELAARGRADAVAAGLRIAAHAHPPTLVLCSSARRAVATLEAMRSLLADPLEVDAIRDLYLAGGDTLLAAIRAASERHASVLVVAHNPGIAWLAHSLARPDRGAGADVQRLSRSFPAGSLAVLEFDVDCWRDVVPGSGALTGLSTPGASPAKR